ncbi:MAG: peptide deformylase [Actinomycetota bacterium]
MPVRPVIVYPDPLLKSVCRACGEITGEVRRVAQDLVDTMRAHDRCVGLAAPQIGELLRIIAVDVRGHPKATVAHGLLVIVDPLVVASDGSEIGREGCLSLPSITANVPRATRIYLRGLTLDGEEVQAETSAFEARAILHEVDHLDGILILDRAASPAEVFQRKTGGGGPNQR